MPKISMRKATRKPTRKNARIDSTVLEALYGPPLRNPAARKKRKNPIGKQHLDWALTGRQSEVILDPEHPWKRTEVHPARQSGQLRMFSKPEMGENEWTEGSAAHDPFVYGEVPESEPWSRKSWISRLRINLDPLVRFSKKKTKILQVPLGYDSGDVETLEIKLESYADDLNAAMDSKLQEEADDFQYLEQSFEDYLADTNADLSDQGWGGSIDELVERAKDLGADEDELNDIFSDSSNWTGVKPGDAEDADWRDDIEREVVFDEDQQKRFLKNDILEPVSEILEKFIPQDLVEDAVQLWAYEALSDSEWTVTNTGDWTAYARIEAHASIRVDRVERKLRSLIEQYEEDLGPQQEGTLYTQRAFERRPYVAPETSVLLEHISLPHDYSVYNVSWEEFQDIGEGMSICVGGHGYAERVRRGEIQIWLVRDPNGANLFCLEVHFADPENVQPEHFVQVKGTRNRFPGWSDKDFYAYGSTPYTPLRTRAENPMNVDVMLTKRELREAQPVPGGEVALCRALCEQAGLNPYLQPDLLCGLYAKERFEVFDAREEKYREALARAQRNIRENPRRGRRNPTELLWPHGTSFAVEYWHDVDEDDVEERQNPLAEIPVRSPPPSGKYRAMWIGGPPGQTMVKIKKKLEKENIDVLLQAHDRKIPPMVGYDLVLFNIEHASHGDYYLAKEMAKNANVPFVIAGHAWPKTFQNLVSAGFVRQNPRRKRRKKR